MIAVVPLADGSGTTLDKKTRTASDTEIHEKPHPAAGRFALP